jgi:hypothetical protein
MGNQIIGEVQDQGNTVLVLATAKDHWEYLYRHSGYFFYRLPRTGTTVAVRIY